MKRIISFMVVSLMILASLTGCSQTHEKKPIDYTEVEVSNVENDMELIENAQSIYQKNYNKSKKDTERSVAVVKYLDDVYQIASNRVNLDLEILDAFSTEYQDYIATCQAFSEVYLKERDKLVDTDLLSVDAIKQTDTGKMVDVLSETIDNFIKK